MTLLIPATIGSIIQYNQRHRNNQPRRKFKPNLIVINSLKKKNYLALKPLVQTSEEQRQNTNFSQCIQYHPIEQTRTNCNIYPLANNIESSNTSSDLSSKTTLYAKQIKACQNEILVQIKNKINVLGMYFMKTSKQHAFITISTCSNACCIVRMWANMCCIRPSYTCETVFVATTQILWFKSATSIHHIHGQTKSVTWKLQI